MRTPRTALLVGALLALTGITQAQVAISGNLSDSTTGPLLSGTVYHATTTLTVPVGQTLTAQPGAIVKFPSNLQFNISGTLDANGTSGSPVVFTSIEDDTAGGDTNANGASSGTAGDWRGLVFTTDDASDLAWCEVRFSGQSGFAAIDLNSADISISNTTVNECAQVGLQLSGNSFPTVSDCSFIATNLAVDGLDLDAVAGFTDNAASGGAADYMRITVGTLDASATLTAANVLEGALVNSTSLTVAAGATLTVEQGVVFKALTPTLQVNVTGTLDVNGASGNPVVFTSYQDDSAGGDTNGDGASSGAAGQWRGLILNSASDASDLSHCEVRFGGNSGLPGIDLNSSDATLSSCVVRDCSFDGLSLSGNSYPTVSGCTFTNTKNAVTGVDLDAVAGFTNNSASGGSADYMLVSGGLLDASATFSAANVLEGALVNSVSLTIPDGVTLTLGAGVAIKPLSSTLQININGVLDANGTSGSPVVFTSYSDDTVAGDTNGDGASSGAAGDWRGLVFGGNSDPSDLEWVEVRYFGGSAFAAVGLSSADISMSNCVLRDGSGDGVDLASNSFPTVADCTIDRVVTAVDGVQLGAVPGFSNNSGTGSTANYMNVTAGVAGNLTIASDNVLNGALVCSVSCSVPGATTLTLEPGVVFKMANSTLQWNVSGNLVASGTEAEPIVFTSIHDDSIAGDTNGNAGGTAGGMSQWRGLIFDATSDASNLEWVEVRYGGASGFELVILTSSNLSMRSCTMRGGGADGLRVTSSQPTVRDCAFLDNAFLAVDDAPLQAVPGFSFNTASGNGGDYMEVVSSLVTEDLTIEDHNVLNGALVLMSALTINAPGSLEMGPGVAVKFGFTTLQVDVASGAALVCNGTLARPVSFTSLANDAVAGDTNGDGTATSPVAGGWRGVTLSVGSVAELTNTNLSYGGNSAFEAIDCNTSLAVLDGVRCDSFSVNGIDLDDFASATRLCAFDCGGDGIVLNGGSLLTRSSAVSCVGDGISQGAATVVRDSIAWGNGADFVGFGPLEVFYSNGNGVPAGNGNLTSDPLFVDQVNGDLRLTAASPSVDTGDPAAELDPDCTRADMGAHPYDQGGPSTYCTSKTNSLGCDPFVDFLGYASATDADAFSITANDVLNNKNGLFFYGFSSHNGNFQGGTKCVLNPVRRTPVQDSGGDLPPNNCSGTYVLDMNARIQSGVDAALVPGVSVYGQFWMRDPQAPFTTGLTNGIEFPICP